MAINLTDPVFNDETKAREHLEAIRWPDGKPVCPHCGSVDRVYRLHGKSHRPGLIHCNNCDGSFTVTTGSVMESSHVPLHKWVLAYRLMASSKKGISAHQLHRTIGVTYKMRPIGVRKMLTLTSSNAFAAGASRASVARAKF
jgi:transposase-like protein